MECLKQLLIITNNFIYKFYIININRKLKIETETPNQMHFLWQKCKKVLHLKDFQLSWRFSCKLMKLSSCLPFSSVLQIQFFQDSTAQTPLFRPLSLNGLLFGNATIMVIRCCTYFRSAVSCIICIKTFNCHNSHRRKVLSSRRWFKRIRFCLNVANSWKLLIGTILELSTIYRLPCFEKIRRHSLQYLHYKVKSIQKH